jgi:hypothetical protein
MNREKITAVQRMLVELVDAEYEDFILIGVEIIGDHARTSAKATIDRQKACLVLRSTAARIESDDQNLKKETKP